MKKRRYILTGAPGSGKTTIINSLSERGYSVVREAATDVIAIEHHSENFEPWTSQDFIENIVFLQKKRQLESENLSTDLEFYDRAPICTYALAQYLGFKPEAYLLNEIERIQKYQIYEKQVFFIENLGFITHTDARRISYDDALKFEKIHISTYQKFGYECVFISAGQLEKRVKSVLSTISSPLL